MKFSHLHERERIGDLTGIAVTPHEYADFLTGVMDSWLEEDDPLVEISEISSLIQILTGGSEKGCIFAGTCDRYLTIEYDGTAMWYDTIGKPYEMRVFGNIVDGLDSIVTSSAFRDFQSQLAFLHERTRNEPWYPFLSFGCIGDYPELPLDNTHVSNTYADGWMHLVRAVAERLTTHGYALSRPIP